MLSNRFPRVCPWLFSGHGAGATFADILEFPLSIQENVQPAKKPRVLKILIVYNDQQSGVRWYIETGH